VELEQRRRLNERAKLRNPARAHEQRGQPEHHAIERGQIRRTLSGAITDQDLMLEQQRFCRDGADATGTREFDEGDQQVDGEDEEFAHRTNRTKTASARKTAPHRRVPSYYEFATDRSCRGLQILVRRFDSGSRLQTQIWPCCPEPLI
jgi:hypothetical protein